jgi:superfamily II DNA or RNA helicase
MNIINKLFGKSIPKNTVNVFDRLYDYQKDAVSKTVAADKGIVCMPTGVGKTFCQAAIMADDILNHKGEFRMYVVNAPRIVLTYQLLKDVYGFLITEGIEARYMFVHSGGKSDEKELEDIRIKAKLDGCTIPFSEIGSGTNVRGIREMIKKAKKQDLPLIFFSTYNSAERIQEAIDGFIRQEISIVLNDEAHYLVQEQFHDILHQLKSKRCYFFTATTICTPSDKGRGMNNTESYGEILYLMIPRDAIDMGKMVRPRLHFVVTEGVYNRDDYERSLNKIIKDTFEQHEKILTKTLPKILVSSKGTQDIKKFISNSPEYLELRNRGVDIYAVASNDAIGNFINGDRVRRDVFLKKLKEDGTNPHKRLIVLHYDILAEGIDVSGFSGIMPLRTLNKSKFLQTFGRCARPDKEDRIKMDNHEIGFNDLDKMNKPYAYIMIPSIFHGNEDDKENVIQLITELRDYGFNPEEDIVSSPLPHGIPETEEPEGLNDLMKRLPVVGQIIADTEAELEAEEDAKLSPASLLRKKFNLK